MSRINYDELASNIIKNIGGEENVKMVTHCVTRLRFYLKNIDTAKDEEIKQLPGVLGVVFGNGQYQVILGEHLFPVFDAIITKYAIETEEPINENLDGDLINEKRNLKYYFEKVITFMSQALTPFITVVYGAGMLRVVLSLISFFAPEVDKSSTYQLFNYMALTPFYFMPILVAYGTSKVLKSNPAFAIAMAAALLYPDFNSLMAAGELISMFSIPVHLGTYGNTLLPGIFAAILCAYLEKWFYRIIPGMLKSVFAPLCIFLVGFPITVLVLGPAGSVVGSWIVTGIVWLQAHAGGMAPGIIAATHPFLVMMGVNMLMVGPMTELLARVGFDSVFRPGWIIHNVAEGGACMAVALRTKNSDLRTTAISAGVGAFLSGVSEPALYGINLLLKKPMIGLVLGGFVGGSVAGIMGAKAFSMGYSSVLGVVIFEQTIFAIIAGIAAAFLVSFFITLVLYNGKEKGE